MGIITDYTKRAKELKVGMKVNMPSSYRKLHIEAIHKVSGGQLLIVGLPDGGPLRDFLGESLGMTQEQMDARRTYITLKEDDPVTATFFEDEEEPLPFAQQWTEPRPWRRRDGSTEPEWTDLAKRID